MSARGLLMAAAGTGIVPPTVWDPARKAANITLSNGNLTATGTGSGQAVFSTTAKSSGKCYFEVKLNQTPGTLTSVGIANSSEPNSVIYIGNTVNSAGILPKNNNSLLVNAVTFSSFGAAALAGDTISWAINFGTTPPTAWVATTGMRTAGSSWNNIVTADPGTNTGGQLLTGLAAGPYYASFGSFIAGDSGTANFGASAFTIAVPTGFTAWNLAP